jgi:hypothetical protein
MGLNGTTHFKNANNCLNINIYSYLETSGGQSYNLYLNVVHFLTPVLIRHQWELKTVVFLHWCLILAPLLRHSARKTFTTWKLSINIESLMNAECRFWNAESHYTACSFILSVIILSLVALGAVILSVVILSVMAPFYECNLRPFKNKSPRQCFWNERAYFMVVRYTCKLFIDFVRAVNAIILFCRHWCSE